MTTTYAEAARYVAEEIAWNGSASLSWISRKLERGGYPADIAADIADYGVSEGFLKYVPWIGSYTAGRKVNAEIFGRRFADYVAGD